MPPGETFVRWQAMDLLGNVSERGQRVDVELGSTCSAAAGSVGPSLRVDKRPGGRIHLSWEASCAATDVNYGVYEGRLGDFASHRPRQCSTQGATEHVLFPWAGNRYYLVVPANPLSEGSYGVDGDGRERRPASSACRAQALGACATP